MQTSTSQTNQQAFPAINPGYNHVFQFGELSLGLVVPVENYARSAAPSMQRHRERAVLAEELGFRALWLRDVIFNVPSFGDAGQTFDPFVYLGYLAAHTSRIALGVASMILPLRHPAHVARAAASADVLSNGRLILGIASGDRPEEYPALNADYATRGERFRASYEYIRAVGQAAPEFAGIYGQSGSGIEMLPRPAGSRLPLLVTGGSQQRPDWIAEHADGWILYPRGFGDQAMRIRDWQSQLQELGRSPQPVMEPLYIDLLADADAPPRPIHLGYQLGSRALVEYLQARAAIGVNHIALNLRFQSGPEPGAIEDALERLARDVLPIFHYRKS